jgi:hypothetical protein
MKTMLFSYLTTLIVVALAGWAAVSLYLRYMQHPWTRDGQVRANIVGIAPRVSGPIIHVASKTTKNCGRETCSSRLTHPIFKLRSTLPQGRFRMIQRLSHSSSKIYSDKRSFTGIT